ncbi:MAG: adenylosuccinate lyase [Anaerolineae bacterium]
MSLRAISPLDGRYHNKLTQLEPYFSEYALMRYRVLVEVTWLRHLSEEDEIADVRPLTETEIQFLTDLHANFDDDSAQAVKDIEREINHDVKAIEYYIKGQMASTSLADLREFVHFACTSEDINNLAYAMMVRDGLLDVWLESAYALVGIVSDHAEVLRDTSMLAHTHGQPASPTTMGKELAVFVYRWQRQVTQLENQPHLGKFSGAVGAFNAHQIAYPDADWVTIGRTFVERFGLVYNPLTTQIESHDYLAEIFHMLIRFNSITLDLCRDMWTYISMGYFSQRTIEGEVGSSTMPHKVNPIDFENAEANLGLSNSILAHLAEKLTVSRLQRDLSDSSALRNIGVGIAHSQLALISAQRGLSKVAINPVAINADLDQAWQTLAEAIQMVLRKSAYPDPYEALKQLTRGVTVTPEQIRAFVSDLPIAEADKARLLALTPATYTGLASDLVDFIGE